MPRYENVEGVAAKYWEIEIIEGTSIVMRAGRMDGALQDIGEPTITTKKYKTVEDAAWKYDELIANRIDKGYQLVAPAPLKADTQVPQIANLELEAAILNHPDNVDAYLVYGDWLHAQGDPRGELIALQAAKVSLEAAKEQERQLQERYREQWLGSALSEWEPEHLDCEWHYGFLKTLRIGATDEFEKWATGPRAYADLIASSSAKFLEDLEVNLIDYPSEGPNRSLNGLIDEMADVGVPSSLRHLVVDVKDYQMSWTELGDLSKIYSKLTHLQHLKLRIGGMEFGKRLTLPSLESLEIVTSGLSKANVTAIAKAKWPKLKRLCLYFGTQASVFTIDDVLPLLDKKLFPELLVLALCNSDIEDEIAREVMRSNLLPQLQVLDLSHGTIGNIGAEALLANADALQHLILIIVNHGYISEATVTQLQTTFGPRIQIGDQEELPPVDEDDEDPEDLRFVSLHE